MTRGAQTQRQGWVGRWVLGVLALSPPDTETPPPNPLPSYAPVFWKVGCEGGEHCGDHTIHPSLAPPVWATPTLRT